jgi:hypothetical protein
MKFTCTAWASATSLSLEPLSLVKAVEMVMADKKIITAKQAMTHALAKSSSLFTEDKAKTDMAKTPANAATENAW